LAPFVILSRPDLLGISNLIQTSIERGGKGTAITEEIGESLSWLAAGLCEAAKR